MLLCQKTYMFGIIIYLANCYLCLNTDFSLFFLFYTCLQMPRNKKSCLWISTRNSKTVLFFHYSKHETKYQSLSVVLGILKGSFFALWKNFGIVLFGSKRTAWAWSFMLKFPYFRVHFVKIIHEVESCELLKNKHREVNKAL